LISKQETLADKERTLGFLEDCEEPTKGIYPFMQHVALLIIFSRNESKNSLTTR
jgi:hypothetical protein